MERDLRDIKEEVRARTDIVEIIGGYTRLKRSGKNWTGLCPFHADKNPSFNVSPETQSYRCWSCGEKGDVFTFVMKKESLDFVQALEKLAKQAGIAFERRGSNPQVTSEKEQMRELNRMAVQFFQERLAVSAEAKAYLAQRAILKPTQEQFEIGFAANEWEGLTFYLQRRKADLLLAAKIGLIKTREKERGGGFYDTYRNRIMFPIHDLQGDVIGFGGRAMSPEEKAKYINSEQSLIFNKSQTLYGLYFAKKGKLSEERPPVFVEGYVDVITAHQAGFTQCVATLGTSMTEEHATILSRYSKRVVICYDADRAGISATLRGATVWESLGVEGAEVRVARLPAGDDPDSLLKRGDTATFQAALDNAIPRVDFEIELALSRHDLHTEEGKEDALAEIIPILATIRSRTQRDRKTQQIAYLHPSSQYDLPRAIRSILADAEQYAAQGGGSSPRDRGYPRTTEANAGPLQEQAPPPSYRPASRERWGQFDPGTRNIVRKGDGNGQGRPGDRQNGYGRGGYGGVGGKGKGRYGRNEPQGPQGDPTPPSLVPPILNGAQKAERTLLRALLAPETRANLLAQLDPNLLVTPQARGLYAYIARTPANADGGIDSLPLLYQIEREEEEEDAKEDSGEKKGNTDPESEPDRRETASRGRPIKISEYLRDLLEDSRSLMSNEPVNKAVADDCIRRLEKNRADQVQRDLAELLQRPDLTDEQKTAVIEQYHQRMREMRGTPRTNRDTPDGGSL